MDSKSACAEGAVVDLCPVTPLRTFLNDSDGTRSSVIVEVSDCFCALGVRVLLVRIDCLALVLLGRLRQCSPVPTKSRLLGRRVALPQALSHMAKDGKGCISMSAYKGPVSVRSV